MFEEKMAIHRLDGADRHHISTGQAVGALIVFGIMLWLVTMVIIWAWSPTYKTLLNPLNDRQAFRVLNALYTNGFDAKLDESTGAILIPASDVHLARIKLTSLGLPQSGNSFSGDWTDEEQGSFSLDNDVLKTYVNHTQRVETILSRRIERILEPLVGSGSVRAQVTVNTSEIQHKNIKQDNGAAGQDGMLASQVGNNNLLITVIVDNKRTLDEGGVTSRSRTPDELQEITELVQNTIGFNAGRGDRIDVINTQFAASPVINSGLPYEASRDVWQQEGFRKTIGVVLAVLLVLITLWLLSTNRFVLSKGLATKLSDTESRPLHMLNPSEIAEMNFEENLRTASLLASNDPKLVAQVIKNWVNADGR